MASDVVGLKLKRKHTQILLYLEDGTCSKRVVVLSQELAKQITGARPEDLKAWKKSDRPRYDTAMTRGADSIRQLEGVVTLRFTPLPTSEQPAGAAPDDSWVPCVESVEKPSSADTAALVAYAAQCGHDEAKRSRGI